MKRDMDLIRKILLKIEEHDSDDNIQRILIDGYSNEEIAYNVYLLKDAGLIDGTILFGTSSIKPKGYVIQRLNWSGCEFLDACRDEGRWMKAKVVIDEMKGASFDIIKAVLIDLMKRQVSTILTSGTI